jgi:hypothetical protein
MKKFAIIILSAVVFTGLLSAQGPGDRFGGLKAKIDALLSPRIKPDPLPDKAANPFQFTPPGSAVVLLAPDPAGPSSVEPEPDTLTDDERILTYAVARLRVTGLVQRGGVSHLLINSATYKVADLIPVRGTGETVYYIRVVRITDHEVTFGYNGTTLAVPLPN